MDFLIFVLVLCSILHMYYHCTQFSSPLVFNGGRGKVRCSILHMYYYCSRFSYVLSPHSVFIWIITTSGFCMYYHRTRVFDGGRGKVECLILHMYYHHTWFSYVLSPHPVFIPLSFWWGQDEGWVFNPSYILSLHPVFIPLSFWWEQVKCVLSPHPDFFPLSNNFWCLGGWLWCLCRFGGWIMYHYLTWSISSYVHCWMFVLNSVLRYKFLTMLIRSRLEV